MRPSLSLRGRIKHYTASLRLHDMHLSNRTESDSKDVQNQHENRVRQSQFGPRGQRSKQCGQHVFDHLNVVFGRCVADSARKTSVNVREKLKPVYNVADGSGNFPWTPPQHLLPYYCYLNTSFTSLC